jgi:hypothetical protein
MTIYPVEFHRRLEQKWATRVDQCLTVTGNAIPPRDPNDDADDDENEEDEEDAIDRKLEGSGRTKCRPSAASSPPRAGGGDRAADRLWRRGLKGEQVRVCD